MRKVCRMGWSRHCIFFLFILYLCGHLAYQWNILHDEKPTIFQRDSVFVLCVCVCMFETKKMVRSHSRGYVEKKIYLLCLYLLYLCTGLWRAGCYVKGVLFWLAARRGGIAVGSRWHWSRCASSFFMKVCCRWCQGVSPRQHCDITLWQFFFFK